MTLSTAARPRTGSLFRTNDVTGVSGTGIVADVVEWPDGSASVRWRGDDPSIVFWDRATSVEKIHGHGGHTHIVWDNPQFAPPDLRAAQAHVMDVLQGEIEHWDQAVMTEALWTVVRDVQPLLAEVATLRTELEQTKAKAAEDHRQAVAVLDLETERAQRGDAQLHAVTEALARAGISHPIGAPGVDALAAQRDAIAAELQAARTTHRSTISDACIILDIAGHHEAARILRQQAGVTAPQTQSCYEGAGFPLPEVEQHRDALAAIAISEPDPDNRQATTLVRVAREALGLDQHHQQASESTR